MIDAKSFMEFFENEYGIKFIDQKTGKRAIDVIAENKKAKNDPCMSLLANLDKIKTTELGKERIKKNLGLVTDDVVDWCVQKIGQADSITQKGKNWYVYAGDAIITINARSYTIITAHKRRQK